MGWKWRSTNRKRKSQSNQGIEDTNKSKGCWKLPRLCKLLLMIYQRFQPHCSTIKLTKRKRRIKMDRRRTEYIQRAETKNNHTTSTSPTQKRRKIQGRSRCIRTCNQRSSFTRTRRQMETNHFPIKNNVTCRKELWDMWQRTTSNSQSIRQMATISTRHDREIWSIDGPQKLIILQRTTQTQWLTSKMISETTRLWLYTTTYPRKDKHKSRHIV